MWLTDWDTLENFPKKCKTILIKGPLCLDDNSLILDALGYFKNRKNYSHYSIHIYNVTL